MTSNDAPHLNHPSSHRRGETYDPAASSNAIPNHFLACHHRSGNDKPYVNRPPIKASSLTAGEKQNANVTLAGAPSLPLAEPIPTPIDLPGLFDGAVTPDPNASTGSATDPAPTEVATDQPTLSALLRVATDNELITLGQAVTLTVSAAAVGGSLTGASLQLTVPAGLTLLSSGDASVNNGILTWILPALNGSEVFERAVVVMAASGEAGTVWPIAAQLSQTPYLPLQEDWLLGLTAATPADQAEPDVIVLLDPSLADLEVEIEAEATPPAPTTPVATNTPTLATATATLAATRGNANRHQQPHRGSHQLSHVTTRSFTYSPTAGDQCTGYPTCRGLAAAPVCAVDFPR